MQVVTGGNGATRYRSDQKRKLVQEAGSGQLYEEMVEAHALAHSLYMADALIAAMAITCSLPLLTANIKHFAAVAGLEIQVFQR